MKFNIITLFPELITHASAHGVLGTAFHKGLLQLRIVNPRQFATDIHKSVDDRPYGGGDGMVMMPEMAEASIKAVPPEDRGRVVYMSPQGPLLTNQKAQALAQAGSVTLLCGRYGGVDQRALLSLADEELSIGDYILSGGELAALTVMDTVGRFVPGVLGHQDSSASDSFSNGLLEAPQFTRPAQWAGMEVPAVLRSGNHALIKTWSEKLSQLVTLRKRPELILNRKDIDFRALEAFWKAMPEADKKVCGIDDLDRLPFPRRD